MKKNNIKWPDIWSQPDSIEWVANGSNFHSKAAKVKWNGKTRFLKVYGLVGKEDSFASIEEIESLIANIAEYRLQLINANITVPNSYSYTITTNSNGKLLYLLESDCGECLLQLLEDNDWDNYDYWLDKVNKLVVNAISTAKNGLMTVGIDPKIANFVVGENNQLTYVDMVWPLNKSSLNSIHPDISKVWEFRYFNRLGILINWIIQFSRLNLAKYDITQNYIVSQGKKFLSSCENDQLLSFFNFTKEKLPEILKNIPIWNVDILRLFGVILAAKTKDYDYMNKVFSLSRTNPHESLPIQRLNKCKDLLTNK